MKILLIIDVIDNGGVGIVMRNMLIQNVSLSTNLKRLRKESGLSQEALTAKINLLGSLLERSAYSK